MNFPNLLGGALGQQATSPLQTVTPGQYYGSLAQYAPQAASINTSYNDALGKGYANTANSIEDIYDPNQRGLRSATSKSLTDELALGGGLDPETMKMVSQNALQTGAGAGFRGGSAIGLGLLARDLGRTVEDMRNKRQQMAMQFDASTPKGFQMYHPESVVSPADAGNLDIANANTANEHNQFQNLIQASNDKNAAGGLMDMGGMLGKAGGFDLGSIFGGGSKPGGTFGSGGGGGIMSNLMGGTAAPAGSGGDAMAGVGGGIGSVAGGLAGAYFGGPIGAPIGSAVGGMAGNTAGGMFSKLFKS